MVYEGQLSVAYCFSLSFRLMMIPARIPRTTGGTNKEGKGRVKSTTDSSYLVANSFGVGKCTFSFKLLTNATRNEDARWGRREIMKWVLKI